MAQAIVHTMLKYPEDRHLIMVTRRAFGYGLRNEIAKIDSKLKIELNFSESLLETWSVREAFLVFCLLIDPDAPTWRAWLGYQDAPTGKGFAAPDRNSDAYLKFLTACKDKIGTTAVEALAAAAQKPPGDGGTRLWKRAKRFVELKGAIKWDGEKAEDFLELAFAGALWITDKTEDAETAKLDMEICRVKARAMLADFKAKATKKKTTEVGYLKLVAQQLRYQIATREPFVPEDASDAQIATLWGAKGITADHVYIVGLCDEAIPGQMRDEYPGTNADFIDEQRRLFYVSITRSKKTLVLSRPRKFKRQAARDIGLSNDPKAFFVITLQISRFLLEIMTFLPDAKEGATG
jgi:superfamily I DNA/RNA helicase